jgi:1-aminocyclopropane-1-carboxylate deaminase/D-cysteine desulfhydrase-like pyridoxal-dependent ACC family enzyme
VAGLIGQIKSGQIMGDGGVVFLHTGGAALLFAYEGQLLTCIAVE